jgi:release factor glutamine methyltransferase
MRTAQLQLHQGVLGLLESMLRVRWLRLAAAGWHFHVDAISIVHDHVWDGTSLLLRKAIRQHVRDGQRVLDLGTGQIGLLAVYCARSHDVEVVAVDVNEEFVENAKLVAVASEVPGIDFRISDWFSNVDGTFDLIFTNCPYVPSEKGNSMQEFHSHPEIWDGGFDGMAHMRKILSQVEHFLNPHGALLLGVDTTYVPSAAMVDLIAEHPGIDLVHTIRSWFSPSEVYVIQRKMCG